MYMYICTYIHNMCFAYMYTKRTTHVYESYTRLPGLRKAPGNRVNRATPCFDPRASPKQRCRSYIFQNLNGWQLTHWKSWNKQDRMWVLLGTLNHMLRWTITWFELIKLWLRGTVKIKAVAAVGSTFADKNIKNSCQIFCFVQLDRSAGCQEAITNETVLFDPFCGWTLLFGILAKCIWTKCSGKGWTNWAILWNLTIIQPSQP